MDSKPVFLIHVPGTVGRRYLLRTLVPEKAVLIQLLEVLVSSIHGRGIAATHFLIRTSELHLDTPSIVSYHFLIQPLTTWTFIASAHDLRQIALT